MFARLLSFLILPLSVALMSSAALASSSGGGGGGGGGMEGELLGGGEEQGVGDGEFEALTATISNGSGDSGVVRERALSNANVYPSSAAAAHAVAPRE